VPFKNSSQYSTDQKERLTERVLLPFHTRSCSRSLSVPYPFSIRSVLVCSRSVSVPSVSCVLGSCSEERGLRELVYKNAFKKLATLG